MGLGAYICDDGSTPDSAECLDGTVAVFYSDTTGLPENDAVAAPVSSISTTTLIVLAIAAYFLFKGHS